MHTERISRVYTSCEGLDVCEPFTKGVATTTNALQDSNLHFDIMNIKFYLLSQEFAYFWEGLGLGLTCTSHAHMHTPAAHSHLAAVISGQNCRRRVYAHLRHLFAHVCTPARIRMHTRCMHMHTRYVIKFEGVPFSPFA